MPRYWVKLRIDILDDYRIGTLPDHQWRAYVESIMRDPANLHVDPGLGRSEWSTASRYLRPALFERDENACRFCGSTENLEADHIIPLARGGANELDNLQILCRSCNRRKWKNIL